MPDVKLSIAGRDYFVACNAGEEQRLLQLGALVDATALEVAGGARGMTETRALLFSALMLADKLHDTGGTVTADTAGPSAAMLQSSDILEGLATRLENLALRLEN
ncbi:cell division protein ZapA [Sphingorhabdus sp.]|jgi:cell division protein ZapA|uniref:cell division protein ZapA n=1 Tax=Sphingorhabdus sp. TaxID=1902408 RepID=UPI0037C70076